MKCINKGWFTLFVALVILPFAVTRSAYLQDILFLVYIKAVLAVAWNIAGGFAGVFSIGHSIFFGVSAYTVALLFNHFSVSPWVGMLAGALLALIISMTLGRVLLRLETMFFALATLGTQLVFYHLAPYFRSLTGGWAGISLGQEPGFGSMMFMEGIWYSIIAAGLLIVSITLSLWVRNSKIGYYFMALREDEVAASACGVNVELYKTVALSVSAVITALAAGVATSYSRQVSPDFAFSWDRSVEMYLFPIVGGIGTVEGPLLGSFLLGPLSEFLRAQFGGRVAGLNHIIYGFVLITVIMWLPEGLVSIRKRWGSGRKNGKGEGEGEQEEIRHQQSETGDSGSPGLTVLLDSHPTRERRGVDEGVILRVANVTKRFGGVLAVDNVSFEVQRGEILGVIGPNGAGKSTLFNVINGFIRADSGIVEFMGKKISGLPAHRVFSLGVGRVFQNLKPLRNMSAIENVMVGAFGRTRDPSEARRMAIEALRKVGFDLSSYDRLVSELNVYEQKLVELARVLAGAPVLILVDEIMAGLKPDEIDRLVHLLKEIVTDGTTLVVIEHRMRAVMKLCDRLVVLHHGAKLCEGLPVDVVKDHEVVEAYLGKRLDEVQQYMV